MVDDTALVERMMAERPVGPLHVFAYGSLSWKRVFELTAGFSATALGCHCA